MEPINWSQAKKPVVENPSSYRSRNECGETNLNRPGGTRGGYKSGRVFSYVTLNMKSELAWIGSALPKEAEKKGVATKRKTPGTGARHGASVVAIVWGGGGFYVTKKDRRRADREASCIWNRRKRKNEGKKREYPETPARRKNI